LTIIFGLSPFRDLRTVKTNRLAFEFHQKKHNYPGCAYALGGDDFCCALTVAPAAFGLPLPDRDCDAGALPEAVVAGGGGGGAAAVLCAVGEAEEG
jgi:hypothetical protein